jgi:hypothetical protein
MEPLGGVRISAQEVYNQLIRLTDLVVSMNGKIDRLTEKQSDAAEVDKDHEARLRSLEKARWPLPSIGLILSAVAVVVAWFHK